MKYLLLLLVIGCTPLRYYPEGDIGTRIPYKYSGLKTYTCYKCKEQVSLYKIDSKGRVIGSKCYLKYIK